MLHFQSILIQAATLNRFFWPLKTAKSLNSYYRSAKLRRAFGIKKTHPLYRLKKLRDAIEHFDERLDSFFNQDPKGLFHFCWIKKPNEKLKFSQHTIRGLELEKNQIWILDKVYRYGDLERSLKDINLRAKEMRKEGGRVNSFP